MTWLAGDQVATHLHRVRVRGSNHPTSSVALLTLALACAGPEVPLFFAHSSANRALMQGRTALGVQEDRGLPMVRGSQCDPSVTPVCSANTVETESHPPIHLNS